MELAVYLLKLHNGNSIYFMRDNMVCFPKSGHIYKLVAKELCAMESKIQGTSFSYPGSAISFGYRHG